MRAGYGSNRAGFADIATDVYDRLSLGPALALHHAVRAVRTRFPSVPSLWSAHLHSGADDGCAAVEPCGWTAAGGTDAESVTRHDHACSYFDQRRRRHGAYRFRPEHRSGAGTDRAASAEGIRVDNP
ncbi:hypothetical protein SAMN05444920_13142 [Nonomuraea solani]|uniref:Uncharacterized protein n=1 Tax=Nonomuraea solani TaxID=1144553 RepID=A0A1H6EYG5_9ACTN|nr:hypothetical protein [Nonomuraea solani]SEH02930.1 hypothetical protein SAMN05444920_13142 [Nonomuraea solani]